MTPNDDDAPQLSPEDARFVQRIAELSAPPEPSAARGTRFDARLAERLEPRRLPRGAAVFAAAAGVLAFVVVVRLAGETSRYEATDVSGTSAQRVAPERATAEETLIALASDQALASAVTGSGRNEALPEDYQAIASLLY